MILYMNFAVDRGQGLDLSSLRILVPVFFFGWSRQLPYKAVSSLLDISEVITREWYQLYGTELVDVSNAVCSFHFFSCTVYLKTPGNLFTPLKNNSRINDNKIYYTLLPNFDNVMLMKVYCSFHKPAEIDQIRYFHINDCGIWFFVYCR
jgi:hypothetical protein